MCENNRKKHTLEEADDSREVREKKVRQSGGVENTDAIKGANLCQRIC